MNVFMNCKLEKRNRILKEKISMSTKQVIEKANVVEKLRRKTKVSME